MLLYPKLPRCNNEVKEVFSLARKSLINRKAAKAADSMWRRKGMFSKPKDCQIPPVLIEQPKQANNPLSDKCPDFTPEKDNPYPLCDNPACPLKYECNISAHMIGPYDEPIYAFRIKEEE
jgi:hypothetical protein